MKHNGRRVLRCIAGIAVIAALGAFACLRGGEEAGNRGPVRMSRASGFYDEPFYLELEGDTDRIYYTTDSSKPDENAILYTGPILISDASENKNVYSMIEDVCIEYRPELLEINGKKPSIGYTLPEEVIDKAVVIRAVSMDAFGECSEIVNAVYFIGFNQKNAYDGLDIVSITTDPENLFDYERGIYVLGKSLDDKLTDDGIVTANPMNLGAWPANYIQRGRDWEKEAHVCVFDADRDLVVSGSFGIRVQGLSTRYMLPKSLNIIARKEYGSEAISTEPIFGSEWQLNSLNLNSGGQGAKTKIHDYLINALVSDLNVLTREYQPCVMFLDGEFWGVYWLTPRFKADYFEQKYGIPGDEVILIKTGNTEIGDKSDGKCFEEMWDAISGNDMSDPEQYARACELMDMESCVDYFATGIYISNWDWPKYNYMLWRTRKDLQQPIADGKWRWIIYDVNASMDIKNVKKDFVQYAATRSTLFCSLLDNADFQSALYSKLVQLAQENFYPNRVDAYVEKYVERMHGAMSKEYSRFINTEDEQAFYEHCEEIRNFFHERYNYIMDTYGEQYGQKDAGVGKIPA